jgi:hypothetical protein
MPPKQPHVDPNAISTSGAVRTICPRAAQNGATEWGNAAGAEAAWKKWRQTRANLQCAGTSRNDIQCATTLSGHLLSSDAENGTLEIPRTTRRQVGTGDGGGDDDGVDVDDDNNEDETPDDDGGDEVDDEVGDALADGASARVRATTTEASEGVDDRPCRVTTATEFFAPIAGHSLKNI